MWKGIRILLLLSVLLYVAVDTWRDQHKNWNQSTFVLLHPINADGRTETQQYINKLGLTQLQESSEFLQQAGQKYRGQTTPFYFKLGRELKELPPAVPKTGSMLDTILWSLKFRYYAWKNTESGDGHSSVTLYLNYYDPKVKNSLEHSTALEKGRIGTVNLFANTHQDEQNNIVISHELLHAFGASDKYDLTTGQPIYPQGFVEPDKQPRYPQKQAELMGGYIPLSPTNNKMPDSLKQVVIGAQTAKEVGWTK